MSRATIKAVCPILGMVDLQPTQVWLTRVDATTWTYGWFCQCPRTVADMAEVHVKPATGDTKVLLESVPVTVHDLTGVQELQDDLRVPVLVRPIDEAWVEHNAHWLDKYVGDTESAPGPFERPELVAYLPVAEQTATAGEIRSLRRTHRRRVQ